MAEPVKGRGAAPAGKALSAEQVVSRFNRLRQDQRGLASKAAELELELNEHRWAKGRELSEFRERHNIRLLGEEEPKAPAREGPEGGKGGPGGVLVS
ncbi:PREDICTED: prefoldin subunit 2 [Sturnus vulgaris]|uniref:prefoldin subunit 2 n=1 Tax=Sturnus vulgaris TaxID=9172 RepID=UPI000719F652|nr:PREDICTED: prefoldin subunit 2 [Sturnus vulgaris]